MTINVDIVVNIYYHVAIISNITILTHGRNHKWTYIQIIS